MAVPLEDTGVRSCEVEHQRATHFAFPDLYWTRHAVESRTGIEFPTILDDTIVGENNSNPEVFLNSKPFLLLMSIIISILSLLSMVQLHLYVVLWWRLNYLLLQTSFRKLRSRSKLIHVSSIFVVTKFMLHSGYFSDEYMSAQDALNNLYENSFEIA